MSAESIAAGRQKPPFEAPQAVALAAEIWGITGRVTPLPGDRDRNFSVTSADARYVLKVYARQDDPGLCELQHLIMARAGEAGIQAPRPVLSKAGAARTTVTGPDGLAYVAALHTWVEGQPYAEHAPHDEGLLDAAGKLLGRMDVALSDLSHPAASRTFNWDVRHASRVVGEMIRHIPADRRPLVTRAMGRFDEAVAALELPMQVIHGDANDYNLMVSAAGPAAGQAGAAKAPTAGPAKAPTAVPARAAAAQLGLIDFGDAVHTWRAAELGIAGAYLAMGHDDPVAALATVVAGYHEVCPLTNDELIAIPHLVTARLCISVCHSALRGATEPDDEYQVISQKAAWDLLAALDHVHPRLATYRLRAACGLEPCPRGQNLRSWLESSAPQPVIDLPLEGPVFDLSVGTTEFDGTLDPTNAALWKGPFRERLEAEGTRLAFGRYLEPRICYQAEHFKSLGAGPERQRTIHLGVDVFAPAGTAVRTPYAAKVVSVRDNDAPLDYGPTVILQHDAHGQPFWTLYGHLARPVVESLSAGDALEAGQVVGHLGAETENGGWPPHLHFQIYADDFDAVGNLPGVAFASQRGVWASISPNPDLILRSGKTLAFRPADRQRLSGARRDALASNLSLSYAEPLHMVRGIGPWLFDVNGHAWLDGVNNVCHLGHAHPAVVRAVARQISVLNTNTRYLHENIVRYARQLSATLPEGLDVCLFVNSGSEANDLALRLARAATGRRGTIVLEGGYHGNLSSLVEISSYKFDGPGGEGPGAFVEKAPSPDGYRHPGITGPEFARGVERAARVLAEREAPAAAFIAESILSCGGQVEPPPGYLRAAYAHARKAGALCIADEVQTGFGRVGHRMWSFELQGVTPDIVTMGKPIGNGFPLGAVVTTRAIADAFANGMEYFNTYGGNPVSCAAGLAVLDTIQREGLQDHARDVGEYLKQGFRALAERHPMIGDVRGQGLFLGLEFVRDLDTLEPADREASWIVNRMKGLGVLLSTDGPLHNVIKIKPPLAFGREHADELLEKLALVLQDSCLQN